MMQDMEYLDVPFAGVRSRKIERNWEQEATFGAPGIATNGARALPGAPGPTTRNKNATRKVFGVLLTEENSWPPSAAGARAAA